MEKHHTERVYDDEMNPLVAQLIKIAQREGIPLLVSAGMICDVNGEPTPTVCMTEIALPKVGSDPEKLAGIRNRHGLAHEILRGHRGFDTAAALMITRHHPAK